MTPISRRFLGGSAGRFLLLSGLVLLAMACYEYWRSPSVPRGSGAADSQSLKGTGRTFDGDFISVSHNKRLSSRDSAARADRALVEAMTAPIVVAAERAPLRTPRRRVWRADA